MIVDIWRFPNFIILSIFALIFAFSFRRRFGIIVPLCISWAMYTASFFMPSYANAEVSQLLLNTVAARAMFAIIIPILFLMSVRFSALVIWIEVVSHLNSLGMIFFDFGITNFSSFNAAFSAMTIPMIWFKPDTRNIVFSMICVALPIAGVIAGGGSTGFLVAAAGFIGVAIANKKYKFIFPSLAIPFIVGFFLEGRQLMSSNQRLDRWEIFMSWWDQNANHLLGTGAGTFEWLGPMIENKQTDAYIFLHNEYLQVIFEQGYIGFVLMLFLFATALWRSRNRPWVFGSVCAIMACMLTQFPLRFVLTEVFILAMLKEALWKPRKS